MSRAPRLLIATLALGLAIPSFCFSAPTSVAAAGCSAGNHVAGDLDSDGLADVVVGVPSYDDDRGAVDILFGGGERRFLRATDLGVTSQAGDRFGASVAIGDIDSDGCADLAIGSPGRDSSQGAVHLVASAGNRDLTRLSTFAGTAAHGSFGAQVLLLTGRQLVVSAPTADDGSRWEAGQVQVLPLTAAGALASARVVLTQNSPGVPGSSEDGDRFGTALAGQDRTMVIGTPDEAVGTRTDAGSVTILSAKSTAPTSYAGVGVTQNTAGVPGTAETGDRFGAAVAFRDHYLLVGVPGETVGSARSAGMVHVLNFDPAARTFRSLRALSQDSSGIPGANESGDQFGSAVALGINTWSQLTAIVGAPGEAIGTVKGAGSVTMFRANYAGGLSTSVRQGAGGIAGAPEAGDRFGASIGVLTGDLDDGEGMVDGVVIGTPGEDIGSIHDAGSVTYTRSTDTWYSLVLEDTDEDDIPADAHFGEVAAQVAT